MISKIHIVGVILFLALVENVQPKIFAVRLPRSGDLSGSVQQGYVIQQGKSAGPVIHAAVQQQNAHIGGNQYSAPQALSQAQPIREYSNGHDEGHTGGDQFGGHSEIQFDDHSGGKQGGFSGGHNNEYGNVPAKYNFDWKVLDDYSNDFGHQETRDGHDVQGSYYVLLPDGRRQTVTYYVNGKSGYVAEVSYEGEAQYPEPTHQQGYQQQQKIEAQPVHEIQPQHQQGYQSHLRKRHQPQQPRGYFITRQRQTRF